MGNDRRLIEDFLASRQVKQCPPGYAWGFEPGKPVPFARSIRHAE